MLGHLVIGQATSTLSGGENIRIKLLKLAQKKAAVIGVDEPFKGLNPQERFYVASYLDELRKSGKTVLVIDHSEGVEQYFSRRIELRVEKKRLLGVVLG